MYTPSRSYLNTHVAGFTYWDGLDVLGELRLGSELSLMAEPENPYDPQAVAIYYRDRKLGYVPTAKNSELAQLVFFGHASLFETRINRLSLEEHPERQVGITIKLRDVREVG
jgi:hypothetical protein